MRSGSKGDVWEAKKKSNQKKKPLGLSPGDSGLPLFSDFLRASRSTLGDMTHRHRHQRPQGSEPCIGYDCFAELVGICAQLACAILQNPRGAVLRHSA